MEKPKIVKSYAFATPSGTRSLVELFEGSRSWWSTSSWTTGPIAYCPGCTKVIENVPTHALAALAAYDVTWMTVSNMPLARGVDRLVFQHVILDLVPYGRQEDWEDPPPGWPQHPTYG